MKIDQFLERCWDQYCSVTADAGRIETLLTKRGETLVNDHVAFRTFNLPGISRLDLGKIFEAWGYVRKDDMEFPEKKLLATYWLHPDPTLPKIFISELLLEKVSAPLRQWIEDLTRGSLSKPLSAESLLTPSWDPPKFEDYERFYAESEYAAWTAAFGIRVNHFTVFVNSLKTFSSLQDLNAFLVENGFVLNTAGGVIKGSPSEKLEQSSTLARRVPWKFAGGKTHEVMSCYYEFGRRYPMQSGGALFQGFIPKSADKIFESTFEK